MGKEYRKETAAHEKRFEAVFAYNRADYDAVEEIRRLLEARGIRPVWMDTRDQRPGNNYPKDFVRALGQTNTALVFSGPHGLGQWQEQEIAAIEKACAENGLHAVNVLLPGGQPVDAMTFSAKSYVNFANGLDDLTALRMLLFAITGNTPAEEAGYFSINAEVPPLAPNCFLAASHATSHETFEIMVHTAQQCGLVVNQPREFELVHSPLDPMKDKVYSPEVLLAIRSATIVIADGTEIAETGKPDADVMYEVGLAMALAKPLIFINNPRLRVLPLRIFECGGNCTRIDYEPNEDSAESLEANLKQEIDKVMSAQTHGGLVANNSIGVSVSYADFMYLQPIFWRHYERIMHYGLMIKSAFAEILKDGFKLRHTAQRLLELACSVEKLPHNYDNEFRAEHNRFRLANQKHQAYVGQDGQRMEAAEAEAAFKVLLDQARGSCSNVIGASYVFFQTVSGYLDDYIAARLILDDLVKQTSARPKDRVVKITEKVNRLMENADLVHVHACKMMLKLLELIHLRKELGGSSYDGLSA